ncbi:trehalose transporter 1-like protein [Arctopsyche grandis]|uniref:trehalose transporter 1-like protein n=1 Tax=Arctopsyche grandis TaxID=121162 RepID=UPI00406D7CC4
MNSSDKQVNVQKQSSVLNQVKATLICHLMTFGFGLAIGWTSSAIPQLLSPEAPLGDITLEESAWVASIFPLGGLVATPLVAILSEKYGKKISLILWTIPFVVHSLAILMAPNVYYLIAGRFVMGLGVAGCMGITSAYVGEIAQVEYRGRLSSLFSVFYTTGITTAFIIGGYISYVATAWAMLATAITAIVLYFYVPETPAFLVRNGQDDKAARSLAWLRSLDVEDEEIKTELCRLQNYTKEKPKSTVKAAKSILFDKGIRRGFLLINGMFIIQCYMGMFAVHNYSVTIFLEGGDSQLSAESAAVIYGCIQIIGALSATKFIDKWGRKSLLAMSTFGVGICMMILATYFYLNTLNYDLSLYEWVPVVFLCFCIYIYSIGAAGIPFIFICDILSDEVRSLATMLVSQMIFFNGFILLRLFAPLSASIGMHNLFYLFSVVSALGGLLTLIFLPETKGKSTKEIMEILSR